MSVLLVKKTKSGTIEVFAKRLPCADKMIIVMGVLAILHALAVVSYAGVEAAILSFWDVFPATSYLMYNSPFDTMMAWIADGSRIAMYAAFVWGYRSALMRVTEFGYNETYEYAMGIKSCTKVIAWIPGLGIGIALAWYATSWIILVVGPLVYFALAIYIGMPFWPVVALAEHFLLKRKIRKLKEQDTFIYSEAV